MTKKIIRGSGGGGSSKPRQPIEAPDSLRSVAFAKIVDMLGEGVCNGFADKSNPLRSVFLNETPVANADGSLNFKNFNIESRTGTQTQDYMKGFDGVESELGVGVELTSTQPYTRTFTNLNLSAVRIRISVPALRKINTDNNDILGYSIEYKIQLAVDNGAFADIFQGAITGKASSKYERSHRIDLPPANANWTFRVVRITLNTADAAIEDTTNIESVTEIIDVKLRMPNTAYSGMIFDAEQFASIPSRAFDWEGLLIKVPTNYDPIARTYTGIWDGTFKTAYSNNPAWAFYDMVLNWRYGLGHLVDEMLVDKWGLYRIGQYCDVMVDNGRGGLEPRFTCNVLFQTQDDALRVIQQLSTVFRGIVYASGGAITAVGDMPEDAVYLYNNSNVIEGEFVYGGSGRKVRHSVALVSWNDMNDMGRAKVEYIEDAESLARYGHLPTDVIAIGCTSQGQARRLGKYVLTTERLETDSVTFGVGLDGTIAAPGKIIQIADSLRAGRRMGGRVRAASAATITLDSAAVVAPGDTLTVILPDATPESRTVSDADGLVVVVSSNFSAVPVTGSVWMLESTELSAQTYRVLGVEEDSTKLTYGISAIQHVPGKYSFVEQGLMIDEPPITVLQPKNVPTPTGIAIAVREVAEIFTTQTVVAVAWVPVGVASYYTLLWRQNNASWSEVPNIASPQIDLTGLQAGPLEVQVSAVNAAGARSQPGYAASIVGVNTTPPTIITDIQDSIVGFNAAFADIADVNLAQDASIANEIIARLAADAGLSGQIDIVSTQAANAAGTATAASTAVNALDARVETVEGGVIANTNSIGQVTASLNGGGPSGNLVANSTFASGLGAITADIAAGSGWLNPTLNGTAGVGYVPAGMVSVGSNSTGVRTSSDYINFNFHPAAEVEVGKRYVASARIAAYRSAATIFIAWLDSNGAVFAYTPGTFHDAGTGTGFGGAAGVALTSLPRLYASGDAPAGARKAFVLVQANGNGSNDPYIWVVQPMLELGRTAQTLPSAWSSGGGEYAQATTILTASVNSVTGAFNASYSMALDVNGYVTGWKFNNNGTTGDLTIVADRFRIVTPGFAPRTPFAVAANGVYINTDLFMGAGRIISVSAGGAYMKAQGTGFGSSNQFVEWYGPYNANLNTCTESNAVYYLKTNGSAYFGGTLSAGVLKNAVQSSTISATATVETGAFGTNGNAKTVVWSFSYNNTGFHSTNLGAATLNATVTLQRSYNGGAWTTIAILNPVGSRVVDPLEAGVGYPTRSIISGSSTFTDNTAGTGTFNYRLLLSGASNWPITYNVSNSADPQRLSIISTES